MSSTATLSSSSVDLEAFVGQIYYDSRRLLLHSPFRNKAAPGSGSTIPAESPSGGNGSQEMYMGDSEFDANVVMILAVLLCALICALGLNSIIRCALRCSSRRASAADRAAANTAGIKKKALKTFPLVTYSPELVKLPGVASDCIICLSEFARGEKLRVLPKCNHGFHAKCIDKWLGAHSTCPTCRQCLLDTCKKIVGCDGPTTTQTTLPVAVVLSPSTPAAAVLSPSTPAAAVLSPSTPAAAVLSPSTPAAAVLSPSTPAAAVLSPSTPAAADSVVINIVPLEREGLVVSDQR